MTGRTIRSLLLISLTCWVTVVVGPVAASPVGPAPLPEPGEEVLVLRDIQYARESPRSQSLDAYIPLDGVALNPAVVLIHGGGWSSGDKSDVAAEAFELASRGFAAFSINYRLLPAYTLPAGSDDARAAVRYIRTNALVFDVDPRQIGALGFSAGGHLAATLATLTDGRATEGSGVRVGVSWSGVYDMYLTYTRSDKGLRKVLLRVVGCRKLTSSCIGALESNSPVNHVSTTDAPMLIVHSLREFVPVEQAREFSGTLAAHGIATTYLELPGKRHARGFRDEILPGTKQTVFEATVEYLRTWLR